MPQRREMIEKRKAIEIIVHVYLNINFIFIQCIYINAYLKIFLTKCTLDDVTGFQSMI